MGGAWGNSNLRPVGADRRIYCYIDGKSHGIGWICKELNARNLKATFFAEGFGALIFGEDETREWFQYLLDQGQDVQLHTHLSFYFFSQRAPSGPNSRAPTDNLADIEGPLRGELLEQACEIFRRMAGYDPVAYRAGNWRMDRRLLQDLRAQGIVLDTSFNRGIQGSGSFDEGLDPLNALQFIEGIWELPVTVAHQGLPVDSVADGLRAVTATSLSRWELRKVLDDSHASGATHVCIAFHSFHGVKPKDVQYTKMKPDRIVQRRFEFLLDYLAANQDRFHVSTVGELAGQLQTQPDMEERRASVPKLGFFHPLARKLVQGINSIYF